MENEYWLDIEGFEGKYQVSNKGEVISLNYNNTKYIQEPKRTPKKKWDLCERCYNSLVRGIEKGVQKK